MVIDVNDPGAASIDATQPVSPRNAPDIGVNVVGFFRAEFGQGEVARRLVEALERGRISVSTLTYEQVPHRQRHNFADRRGERYGTNIYCLNAEHLLGFAERYGAEFMDTHYSIGVWFWEVSTFPDSLRPAFDLVDELWVASDFIRDVLSRYTEKPVLTFPLPVEMPSVVLGSREPLHLSDDRVVFLFVFDFYSTLERKNPLAVIDAFKRAFPDDEEAVLVLKSINGDKRPSELEHVRRAADHPGIRIVDEYTEPQAVRELIAASDCFVSLHRSEGFGLSLAEAMAHGKPVIATGYSGNLTFMDEENAYLVPYRLATVPDDCPPYPAGAIWADPDIDAAAAAMRTVVEKPQEARARGERGRETVRSRLSIEETSGFVTRRLVEIEPLERERRIATDDLRRAAAYLRVGPNVRWDEPSRFGPPGLLARRILHRVLRPYLVRHREFESAIVAALRTAERTNNQRRDQIHHLIAGLDNHLTALEDRLHAPPYTAHPELLRTVDDEGREAIGYVSDGDRDPETSAYFTFEEMFRGPEERVRDLQRHYLEMIGDRRPVLDVGCGRGEFLDLLAEAGIPATGIDLDPSMVARCQSKGLDVERADAVPYLEAQDDETFGVIFASHVVEHLAFPELLRFLELAHSKLAGDGLLVFETVNPHALPAFKTFWTDLSHESPIFPEVAVALCRSSSYASAQVIFPRGCGDLESDRRTATEYAVIATKF